MTKDYFNTLYTNDDCVDPSLAMPLFDRVSTAEMNEELCRPFTDEEIGDALFQIGPLKAPGLDGFPARFFQRNWGLLKEDIIQVVWVFFFFTLGRCRRVSTKPQ